MRSWTLLAFLLACSAPTTQSVDAGFDADAGTRGNDASIDPAATAATYGLPKGFGFVAQHSERTFVIVDLSPSLPTGAPSLVSYDPYIDVVLAAPVESWPESLQTWREITLRNAEGAACDSEVRGLRELRWVDQLDLPAGTPNLAERGWNEAPREAVIAVEVSIQGECVPLWAHPTAMVPAQSFTAVTSDTDGALETFRDMPVYREIATEYARFLEEERASGFGDELPERWVDYDGLERATRFVGDRGQMFVLVEAAAGPGCGTFGDALWHLYESVDGELVVRASGRGEPAPMGLIQVDGRLLLLGYHLLAEVNTDEPLLALDTEPFFCPC